MLAGSQLVADLVDQSDVDLVLTGDMGIGNTTPAACVIAASPAVPPPR